jgi:hypothetical protein
MSAASGSVAVPVPKQLKDWDAESRRYTEHLTQELKAQLARLLGLPVSALDVLPNLGYTKHGIKDREGRWISAWTSPMTDARGTVIGIVKRFAEPLAADSNTEQAWERFAKGSAPGLFAPVGWRERPGPVFVVEGVAAVLALTMCGLASVGRPANAAGINHLSELLASLPSDRQVIILAGRGLESVRASTSDRAIRLADSLRKWIPSPVAIAYPQDPYQNVYEWVCDLAAGQADGEDWPAIGTTIIERCVTSQVAPGAAKSRWPEPIPVSQLSDYGNDVEWLLHGCLARQHITLFSALMKAGKSTFVGHLLRHLQSGTPFLGLATRESRTLVISEESETIWRRRRDTHGLDDHLHLICRPMMVKPSTADWTDFVGFIGAKAIGNFDLVIVDTLSAFAPWKSENDAAEVMATLTPLNQLTSAGLAVLATHHHGKTDQSEGRASRGSTAIAGAVDVILELRRLSPADSEDRRRVLTGLGRFEEIPKELVITLNGDGSSYSTSGDRKALVAQEIADMVRDCMTLSPPGLTADEIIQAMPEDRGRRSSDVRDVLKKGAEAGSWQQSGSGVRGDPWRYWRPQR